MKRRLRLCAWLIAANLAFIWGNSLIPGELSGALSDWLRSLLEAVLPGDAGTDQGSGLLRKLMHFAEFCCLGLLLTRLFTLLGKRSVLPPLLFGVAAACIDETIQRFVPGRGPSLRDVGIDTAGVLTGMILFYTGYQLYQKLKIKHLEEMK